MAKYNDEDRQLTHTMDGDLLVRKKRNHSAVMNHKTLKENVKAKLG